jgi:hypothetical protein
MSFTSWIDQQIETARERGAFDNLPGAGKPLPGRNEQDDGQAWIRDYARREGVSAEEMLPTPLRLRKQAARLAEAVTDLGSEREVRDAVAELNKQIIEWRRIPLGPAIFVPLVDSDAMLAKWRAAHPANALAKSPAEVRAPARGASAAGDTRGASDAPAGGDAAAAGGMAARGRPRWWRRLRSRRMR